MTYQDWLDWKSSPVTKEFFNTIRDRISDVTDTLVTSAGIDPIEDNKHRGYIIACNDIIHTEYEEDEYDSTYSS